MALKSKAKGFVYKPRTADQVKGRAQRKNSKFDSIFKQGFDSYRPKVGDNLFRYLPPSWDDADHYGYTAHVHRSIGPDNSTYLCPRKMLNKPCPVCEAAKEAKDAGETEESKALGTSERIISWVLDRDGDDPEKPLLYDQSWTQDRDIVSLCVNERSGEILMIDHPDNGYDVTIKRTGTGMRTKYYGYAIAREDSPIHDSEKAQDEILDFVKGNQIPDVLQFYDYEYLKGVLSGTVAAKDEALDKEDDEVVETPKRSSKPVVRTLHAEEEVPFEEPTTRRGPRRDQELDEEEEVTPALRKTTARRQVEEEVEDAPAPRRSVRRPEPVDEEVNEEVDEETGEVTEEKPARRSTAAVAPTNRRTRVVEEVVDEEDETPPPRVRSSVRR